MGEAIITPLQHRASTCRALRFLQAEQTAAGAFPSLLCGDRRLTCDCETDEAVFPTTYVLDALSKIRSPVAEQIAARCRAYLLSVREAGDLWRYWPPGNVRSPLVTPDLDDTACARAALHRHRRNAPWNDPGFEAHRAAGGGFYTWTATPPDENVVDCAVNANILYYFCATGKRPPAHLLDYLERCLPLQQASRRLVFYTTPLAFYYHLARAVRLAPALGKMKPAIRRGVKQTMTVTGRLGGPLEDALGAAALLLIDGSAGAPPRRSLTRLFELQEADGGFPQQAYYYGPQHCVANCAYFGSRALTTAIALDALAVCP